jgi:hypothetical protein
MNDKPPLVDRIRSWIRQSGYPLEMATAKTFRATSALHVDSGRFYKDPTTGKVREVDVVATWRGLGFGSWIAFLFVVECKTSADPWVIFRDESTDSLALMHLLAFSVRKFDTDEVEFERELISRFQEMPNVSFLHGPHQAGQAIKTFKPASNLSHQAKQGDSGPNAARDAALQVISSAIGITNEVDPRPGANDVIYTFPIVVTSSPLFICTMTANNKIELHGTGISSVFLRIDIRDEPTIVHIVHESALEEFSAMCAEAGLALGNLSRREPS